MHIETVGTIIIPHFLALLYCYSVKKSSSMKKAFANKCLSTFFPLTKNRLKIQKGCFGKSFLRILVTQLLFLFIIKSA